MGASVLIFANKTDVGDCMSNGEMTQVRTHNPLGTFKSLCSRGCEWRIDEVARSTGAQGLRD